MNRGAPFAISLEESRYTLTGALMVLKPGSITMVATDGHRLAAESGDESQVEFAQGESHLEILEVEFETLRPFPKNLWDGTLWVAVTDTAGRRDLIPQQSSRSFHPSCFLSEFGTVS